MANRKRNIAVEAFENIYHLHVWSDLTEEQIWGIEGVGSTMAGQSEALIVVFVDRRYDMHEVANEIRVLGGGEPEPSDAEPPF